jgi:ribosomal-protein-alanine N-acetyltransferase
LSGEGASGAAATGVEFRPCRIDDLEAIERIERRTFPTPWPLSQFASLLAMREGLGWVSALPGGAVVAYAIGWVAADEAELADLAVAEGRRGEGIGTELVRAFATEAGVRGARRLYLEVRVSNAAARRFYRRLGFERVGRRAAYYREPLEDALVLGVDLPLRGRRVVDRPGGAG